MKSTKLSPVFILCFLSMFACNLPVEQMPPPGDVQTAAALTVQALVSTPSLAGKESPSPALETPSPTSSPTQTMTVTPTYSVPVLTVKESTNCRKGPGEEYEVVFTYVSGKKLEVVGRYDPKNFWLVKSDKSPTGTCWLWGEYADVAGSYWAVSSVTPPPTASPAPPHGLSIEKWDYSCSTGTLTFNLTWTDRENNETGYRIFRDGEVTAELPANSTSYVDTVALVFEEDHEYYLQVYGPGGSANSYTMTTHCWDSD